ncbi:alpha/beta fold hydrolase BchO [Alsobacter sp. R-9]
MRHDRLNWDVDGIDWPHREACRFVDAGGLRWLVMEMGAGPVLVLIHGTGASLHSWRDLAPLLARHFRVVAMDLPGHGFSGPAAPDQQTLPGMAAAVAALLDALELEPALLVGHSAGAAIAVRMALDGGARPAAIISLNGAFIPFRGAATRFFSPIAKLLVLNPFVPSLFAWRAGDPDVVARLLRDTGSRLDERGIALYARLAGNPGHVAGALAMMASWDLDGLLHDISRLKVPLVLAAATEDHAVPPGQAYEVKSVLRSARVMRLRRLGHLAHEENPPVVAALIEDVARRHGVIADEDPSAGDPAD